MCFQVGQDQGNTHTLSRSLIFDSICLRPTNSFTNALCTSVRSSFNHHQIHSKVPHYHPSLMQPVAQPHAHSGIDLPTPFGDSYLLLPINALSALIYSPRLTYSLTHLQYQPNCQFYSDLIFCFKFADATFKYRSVDILELWSFDPAAF